MATMCNCMGKCDGCGACKCRCVCHRLKSMDLDRLGRPATWRPFDPYNEPYFLGDMGIESVPAMRAEDV